MASVEPRTFTFEGLIAQVRQGILRVPRFQRRFVWRRDQVLHFLDSIRRKYPVGSLLIWRTRERYSSFDRLGPVVIPPDEPKAPAEVGYVLDGHQRLSVIFGVFALDDEAAANLRGTDRLFLVYYDLKLDKFVHARHPERHHLPARYLIDHDDELTGWLDERRDATQPGSKERSTWDGYRRRATQTQTTFAQYRLPYLDVTGATLDEAVNIFSRVNSQGTAVRREEVFAALSWKPTGFDFARAANDLLDQYPLYRSFGTKPILQGVLAALGESIYDANWESILERHGDRLPRVMEEVGESLGSALDFLDRHIGASSGKVVPYSVQIVLLIEFYRLCANPGTATLDELERWLWATSFASAYSSANEVLIDDAVERMHKLARGDETRLLPDRLVLRPFPRRFHPKSARVRVFHLFLKRCRPRDPSTGEVIEPAKLLRNGMGDARKIISGDSHSFRLAGRILVGSRRRPLRRDIEALPAKFQMVPQPLFDSEKAPVDLATILGSHLIPRDALTALLADDIDTFLDLRERELILRERAFAEQFVDLPADEFEEEPEIDVEEVPESDL
jgi:hypothetical protein